MRNQSAHDASTSHDTVDWSTALLPSLSAPSLHPWESLSKKTFRKALARTSTRWNGEEAGGVEGTYDEVQRREGIYNGINMLFNEQC